MSASYLPDEGWAAGAEAAAAAGVRAGDALRAGSEVDAIIKAVSKKEKNSIRK